MGTAGTEAGERLAIVVVGPGRAGLALALAARNAGHRIAAVVGREAGHAEGAAATLGTTALVAGEDPLPAADLLVIATRDGAVADVARGIAPTASAVTAAVHLSGLLPVSTLEPLASVGLAIGAFHPLQTLPTPAAGAARMEGAWIGVTARGDLHNRLHILTESMGAYPFDIEDAAKPLYHAAAAAAANLPLAALTMAHDLFEAAGVPFDAARPLVEAVVANAFAIGPRPALTGPVARGDVATVSAQLDAVADAAPQWLPAFAQGVMQLAAVAGTAHDFEEMLLEWEERR